LQNESFLFKNA